MNDDDEAGAGAPAAPAASATDVLDTARAVASGSIPDPNADRLPSRPRAGFRLAQVTDVHLGPLPHAHLRELVSRRVLGYYNWHRNRRDHFHTETLAALVEDLHAQAPDHVIVSGDLCNISLKAEFVAAAAWLVALGPPDQVSVVPGNHDAYGTSSRGRAWKYWKAYMTGDGGPAPDAETAFPYLRRRGDLAIIGLSSAVAAPPTFATGYLGRRQMVRLDAMLEEVGDAACRVIVLHHPPRSSLSTFRRRLTDGRRLRRVLARHQVEMVICGHEHRLKFGAIDGPERLIPIVVGPTAGLTLPDSGQDSGYLLYDIEHGPEGWQIDYVWRSLDPATGLFKDARRDRLTAPADKGASSPPTADTRAMESMKGS